jgi:HEAT repeat protein
MKNLEHLRREPDWPDTAGEILIPELPHFLSQTLFKRPTRPVDEVLLEILRLERFLLLSGPPNSGKRTLVLALVKRWSEDWDNRLLTVHWEDCAGLTTLPNEIALGTLRRNNSQDEPNLYVLADCESLMADFGRSWQLFFEQLRGVFIVLTVNKYAEDLESEDLFVWARSKPTEQKTIEWLADQEVVKALLTGSSKYPDRAILEQDVNKHFHKTFDGIKGSANLRKVRQFLESRSNRIDEWIAIRPVVGQDVTAEKELRTDLSGFLRKEQLRLDELCELASGRKLRQIFIKRVVLDLAGDPTLLEQPEVRIPHDARKQTKWEQVAEDLGVAILLADAGYGKTISLPEEVRNRCHSATDLLEQPDNDIELVELAFYCDANELADILVRQDLSFLDSVVVLISRKHGDHSDAVQNFLRKRLEDGKVLLAIDALDEIPDKIDGYSCIPRDVLRDRLLADIRSDIPHPLLLSSRRIGYRSDFLPSTVAREWLLLPFTEPQVLDAARKWSAGVPELQEQFDQLRRTPPIQELLQIPILLMMTAQLGEDALRRGEKVPKLARRSDLYEKSLHRLERRWADRMNKRGQKPTRSQEAQFLPFVEELAWRLWQQNMRSSHFSALEILHEIDRIDGYGGLQQRDLLQDICEAGLLTRPEKQASNPEYAFLHKTILEYLVARYLARGGDRSQFLSDLPTQVRRYASSPQAHVVLWMLAGLLPNANSLLTELNAWVEEQLSESKSEINFHSPDLAPLLVDCLFECQAESIDSALRQAIWGVATRALEAMQRRLRSKELRWKWLADWSLVYRVLRTIELNETTSNGAREIRTLLEELKAGDKDLQRGGILPEGIVLNVEARLRAALLSRTAPVRWLAVWTIGAFEERGRQEVSQTLSAEIRNILRCDADPYVRAVAARALAQIHYPQALEVLKEALEGNCEVNASGAASGLANIRPMKPDVIQILKSKAAALLEQANAHQRDSLLSSVLGALASLVDEAWDAKKDNRYAADELGAVLKDTGLTDIFRRAFEVDSTRVRATAASALGKLHSSDAWVKLFTFLDAPRTQTSSDNLRASVCFALQQLSTTVDDRELPGAFALFARLLRDKTEPWQVRRPAASALGNIAVRGFTTRELIDSLMSGAKDQDEAVAKSCLYSLLRMESDLVFEPLWGFVLGFPSRRQLVCQIVFEHPNRAGLVVLDLLLDLDNRPEVVAAAVSAISRACERAERQKESYAADVDLLNRLAERHIALLARSLPPKLLAAVVSVLVELYKLLLRLRPPKLDSLRRRIREVASGLIIHEWEDVAANAWFLLGSVGDRGDLETFEKMKSNMPDGKVRRFAQGGMDFLAQRLNKRR